MTMGDRVAVMKNGRIQVILINCSGPPRAPTLQKSHQTGTPNGRVLSLKHHLSSGFTGFPN